MIESSSRQKWISMLKTFLIVDGISIALATLGWWYLMEHTPQTYAVALAVTGMVIMMVGGLLFGGGGYNTSVDYQHSSRVSRMNMSERQELDHSFRKHTSFDGYILFIAGLVPIAIGGIMYWFIS